MCLISIAIPAYKATYLKDAILSVLSQTVQDFELIIVNDKSPENITDVVRQFDDPRIRYYINEKNIGGKDPVANWNKCLSYARGEYFALLCDDDVYESTFIEEMVNLKTKYPDVHVFRSRVKIVDSNSNLVSVYPSSPEYEGCFEYMWHKLKWLRRQTISEFFYDTDYIRSLGGYVSMPKAWGADDISSFHFSCENGIVTSNKLLVSFRMSGINISTNDDKNIKEKIEAHILYKKKIDELLTKCTDENLKLLIIKAKEENFSKQVVWCLSLSNMNDYFSIYISKRHEIQASLFIKAFLKKITNILR